MAEWLLEAGIGENRAILVEQDRIIEAAIELPATLRAGAVVAARSGPIIAPGRRALARTASGEVLIEPLSSLWVEGRAVNVEIVREDLSERGRAKRAVGRVTTELERAGPSLAERIGPHRAITSHDPDAFEAAGWSELLDEAASGEIPFSGGTLQLSLTAAMTLFDVDGTLPPADLALAGAAAAARAIRRHGITGSIGVDLPTVARKADRQRAAEAFDTHLPGPFERTAVNAFGFLQIVRRRERRSVPELVQFDPVGAAARALLRRAERVPGLGARRLSASAAVIARLESEPEWTAELARRTGTRIELQASPGLTTFSGHVQSLAS